MKEEPPRRRLGRPPHPDILTPAEWRVLDHVRAGRTNAETAVRLGVSPETVKTHVSNMLAKLGLSDRRSLAQWQPDQSSRDRRDWLGIGGLLAVLFLRPSGRVLRGFVPLASVSAVAVAGVILAILWATPGPSRVPARGGSQVAGPRLGRGGLCRGRR